MPSRQGVCVCTAAFQTCNSSAYDDGSTSRSQSQTSTGCSRALRHCRQNERIGRAGQSKVCTPAPCCRFSLCGTCSVAAILTTKRTHSMIEPCRCAALQDQALPMAGAEHNPVGKGWLIAAFLCIACTLTGSCSYESGGVSCHVSF